MRYLVDLGHCCEHHANEAIEGLFVKAASDPPDDGIWLPMDSPFVARMVELFTRRGLDRLEAVRKDLLAWSSGRRFKPGARVPRPAGMMQRWASGELDLVRLYLEHLPPAEWTLDDHMMAVDFVFQRYLPADELVTEAEWLATRASLMGRVQANMADVTAKQADTLLAAMPTTVAGASAAFAPLPAQRFIMEFARVRAAESVVHLSDSARHRMRSVIADHVAAVELRDPALSGSLETKLLDEFGTLNRDWRRIAVTEAGEAQTTGFVSSLPMGSKVKRVEQYAGACPFCRKIDGAVMTVVAPDAADKNPETMIWLGKTNLGRSASPRKRVGGQLIERSPEEMWQIPVGLVHPHCRGRWVPTVEARPGDDPDFSEWLSATLGAKD